MNSIDRPLALPFVGRYSESNRHVQRILFSELWDRADFIAEAKVRRLETESFVADKPGRLFWQRAAIKIGRSFGSFERDSFESLGLSFGDCGSQSLKILEFQVL